jgi:glycosyltransferase involved in cell wall biosynthesis
MVPSARARVRQYIEPLRTLGIDVHEYPLPMGNQLPGSRALQPFWMAATAASRAAALIHSWRADVTWVSRQLLPAFGPIQFMARQPMILDVDDAVWLNTGGHRVQALARASSMVVCGNNFLARRFAPWNRNVVVIPTAVDTAWYHPQSAVGLRASQPMVIGWTGTSGNFPFLYAIEGALNRVLNRYQDASLLIVADQAPAFEVISAKRVEFVRWTPEDERAALSRFTVGLMPLAKSDWCSGKCSYKMLCCMAVGLPVIVTATGMNREVLAMGPVGLEASSEQDWVRALTTLLDDPALRLRMGDAGRAVIEQHFSLDRLARQYALLFQSLIGEPTRGSRAPVSITQQQLFC